MPKSSLTAEADKCLAYTVAEARARKVTAKATGVSSGTIPVLALVVFRRNQGRNTRPRTIYAAQIGNTPLIRAYIRQLVAAGLLRLEIWRGCRWLTPSLDGIGVAAHYARAIRTGQQMLAREE